jgi:trehalose 6-phosphate synthase/phosphatase
VIILVKYRSGLTSITKVVLVQVASSASEIPELEAQVSKLAMRINSVYSTLTHQPLVLLQQDISYSQFLALLSVADVFMATNLREGLNLTSHDFIHCQDGELASQKHGSLILSEFTGSASIFHGHELLVNPWDYKQCADAINKALEMSPEQKQRNWQYLLDRKSPYTALAWYSNLQSALTESHNLHQSRHTLAVSPLQVDALLTSYNAAQSRLFSLEDDAIFSPDTPNTDGPSSEAIDILQKLALDPKNTIFLSSDRSPEQLDIISKSLPDQIGLIAENGCFAKLDNTAEWKLLFDIDRIRDWRAGIRKVIEYFHERTEGSTVEEHRCSLTFYYENAIDQELAAHQASELADQINSSRGSDTIRVVRDVGAVSVQPVHVSKAAAASMILDQRSGQLFPDFVFVAGGSRGDEALFRWANRLKLPSSSSSAPRSIAVTTLATSSRGTEARAVLPAGWSLPDVLQSLLHPDQTTDGEDEGSYVMVDD